MNTLATFPYTDNDGVKSKRLVLVTAEGQRICAMFSAINLAALGRALASGHAKDIVMTSDRLGPRVTGRTIFCARCGGIRPLAKCPGRVKCANPCPRPDEDEGRVCGCEVPDQSSDALATRAGTMPTCARCGGIV